MVRWFIEDAPIRMKLRLAFVSMTTLLALAIGLIAWRVSVVAPLAMRPVLEIGSGMILATALLGAWLKEAIATPYVTTVVRMEALAAGDLGAPVLFTHYKDCVGRMTRAMDVFKTAVRERGEMQIQAEETRKASEIERDRLQAEVLGRERKIVSASLGKALSKLADGQLGYRLREDLPTEYAQLGADFNRAVDALEILVQSIAQTVGAVRNGASELGAASDDLSRRSEHQAASLEETAAALEQITATVKRTAESSRQASQAVSSARQQADRSGTVLREAVGSMEQIEQ